MPVRNSVNHIPSSPVMKQGIVTILGSDGEINKSAASIRRTLSADMSSKKWLEQNGFFSPLKKILSSYDYSSSSCSSSSSEDEGGFSQTPGQDDVWRSIQANNEMQKTTKMESWGSILSEKSENSLLPPPYVHPLVKRSFGSLSEKSLEICTESLGSETGSDCFSSTCLTECLNDGDEVYKENREKFKDYSDTFADLRVVKYKTSPARILPPPLPSIAGGGDGAPQLHMQSRRENGRLILEAVSVSPKNHFHAQRIDGRLVLTLFRGGKMAEENKKVEEVFDNMEEVGGDDVPVGDGGGDGGYEEEDEFLLEKNLSLSSGMISVHKKWLVTKKFAAVGNMNAKWSNKDEDDDDEEISILDSLPTPERVACSAVAPPPTAASFNAYDYFWWNKSAASGGFINPFITGSESIKNKNPYVKGCKEPMRSLLLIWEPNCIATS